MRKMSDGKQHILNMTLVLCPQYKGALWCFFFPPKIKVFHRTMLVMRLFCWWPVSLSDKWISAFLSLLWSLFTVSPSCFSATGTRAVHIFLRASFWTCSFNSKLKPNLQLKLQPSIKQNYCSPAFYSTPDNLLSLPPDIQWMIQERVYEFLKMV